MCYYDLLDFLFVFYDHVERTIGLFVDWMVLQVEPNDIS